MQRRIIFLNKIYNDAIKGLKYPDNISKKKINVDKTLDENEMGGEGFTELFD